MKNNSDIKISKELNVCQVGVATMIAINLWGFYHFLAIFKQTKSSYLVCVGQNLKGPQTDMEAETRWPPFCISSPNPLFLQTNCITYV